MAGDDLLSLVRKHQAGLLLDTNLLLLFLASEVGATFAARWDRTDQFFPAQIELLRAAVAEAERKTRLVTTPHVLTEATNLAGGGAKKDDERKELNELLRLFALKTRERSTPSRKVAADPVFSRLGLADLAQAFFPRRARPLVLTEDLTLSRELAGRGLPVANLTTYTFPV